MPGRLRSMRRLRDMQHLTWRTEARNVMTDSHICTLQKTRGSSAMAT